MPTRMIPRVGLYAGAIALAQIKDTFFSCSHDADARQFLYQQTVAYNDRKVTRLRVWPWCRAAKGPKQKGPEFSFLRIERHRDGRPAVVSYFDSEEKMISFQKAHPLLQEQVFKRGADEIERKDSMDWDRMMLSRQSQDPYQKCPKVPLKRCGRIDDLNRPPWGTSEKRFYYGIEITTLFNFDTSVWNMVNHMGTDGRDCFQFCLKAAGLPNSVFMQGGWYFASLLQTAVSDSPLRKVASDDERGGDIVLLYFVEEDKIMPIHAFIDMGNGWVLTKNGTGVDYPYRFQRYDRVRNLFEVLNDAGRLEQNLSAPFNPLKVTRFRIIK